MIDHFTLKVSDVPKSKPFYAASLKPLGYVVAMEFGTSCGLGVAGKPDFWLTQDPDNVRPMHFAFHSTDRKAVDAFYAAALASGGRDNGPPWRSSSTRKASAPCSPARRRAKRSRKN